MKLIDLNWLCSTNICCLHMLFGNKTMKKQLPVSEEAYACYRRAIQLLEESGIDFLVGGAFAMYHYTGISRDTKDLDVFCKPSDYPHILKHFAAAGYRTELTDARWLAKIFDGDYFIDLIFSNVSEHWQIDDSWFTHAANGDFAGHNVKIVPAEELIWSKLFVQNRERYDGADINHIILRYGRNLDWERLLTRLEAHWQLLLAQLIQFQYVYPADHRDIIPQWLPEQLLTRAREQYELPPAVNKVTRGPVIDQTQYLIDVKEWGYKAMTITTF